MVMQQQKEIAYQMTMEYIKQNKMFVKSKDKTDDMVKEFAEIENAFYESLTKNSKLFDKCL